MLSRVLIDDASGVNNFRELMKTKAKKVFDHTYQYMVMQHRQLASNEHSWLLKSLCF